MTEPGANKDWNPTERFLRSLKNPTGQCETVLAFILPLGSFMEGRGKILSKEYTGFVVNCREDFISSSRGEVWEQLKATDVQTHSSLLFICAAKRSNLDLTWTGRNVWVSVYSSASIRSHHELQIIFLAIIHDYESRAIQLRTERQWLGCTGNHNGSTSTLNYLGSEHRLKKHRL